MFILFRDTPVDIRLIFPVWVALNMQMRWG